MNFSPSSTSLPRLSKDGLRIQPATEILHHQPLADRSRSGRRDREFKVKDHKVSVRRDRGLLIHRNQGNGTASRNPGAARPAANQNSYNAQSSRASATNMRSGNARRSANPRQGASHNGTRQDH